MRSFSVSLHLSPFEIDDFVAALLDSVHLMSLADEGCESASVCLRSLNWDLLDSITWPVFLVECLSLHSPRNISGLNLSEFAPFQNDYYTTPVPAKVRLLDANIKWNVVENINLLPEKESKKPAKSFKDAVIKYLIDFGKKSLIPEVVWKHGSLLEGCLSKRKTSIVVCQQGGLYLYLFVMGSLGDETRNMGMEKGYPQNQLKFKLQQKIMF